MYSNLDMPHTDTFQPCTSLTAHIPKPEEAAVQCVPEQIEKIEETFPDETATFSLSLANNNTIGTANAKGTERQAKGANYWAGY